MSAHRLYNKMFKEYPDTLSVQVLQKMLGIGKNMVYQLINKNQIAHIRIGRRIVVPKIHVIEYQCKANTDLFVRPK